MSLDEQSAPISKHARQCLISFEMCLRVTSSFDTHRFSTIEDEMARFSIWTSNMAVFSSGKACMDHRVREAPEVQRLVLGILEVLRGRIEECIRLAERLTDPLCSVEMRLSVLAQGDFERISDGISSEVGLLHELSNTIRKASRDSQDVKAATSFQMKDDEGNNLEDILMDYFAKNLQDRFPESDDAIRARLATTMVLRRKRILYRRLRYTANPIKPAQPVIKPKIEIQVAVPRQEKETQEQSFPSHAIKPEVEPSRIYSIVQSATTLAPQNFQRASAPSVVSRVRSVDLGSHEELAFPPRPEFPSHGLIEVTCPYCLYVLSNLEMSNEARWRKHVLGDLDALVCLFHPCDEPNVVYRHSKDWLLHMRKHAQRWCCSAKVHGIQNFNSRNDYEVHMRESHQKHYTNAQLDLLAERGMRSSGPLFEVCPLCGGKGNSDDQISGNLIDHIIGHLRSLALKSLPPHYDNDDDTSHNCSDDESVKSRSTVKSLLNGSGISFHSPNISPLLNPDILHDTTQYAWGPEIGEWASLEVIIPKVQESEPDLIKEHMARFQYPNSISDQEAAQTSLPSLDWLGVYYEDDESNESGDSDAEVRVELHIQGSIEPTDKSYRDHILSLAPSLQRKNPDLIDRMVKHMHSCFKRLRNLRRQRINPVRGHNEYPRWQPVDNLPGGDWKGLELFDGDMAIFRRLKGNTNCRTLPLGFLMPRAAEFPAQFNCQLCFRFYRFQSLSEWIKHVHNDLTPFICTFDPRHCTQTFQTKGAWIAHENERHRYFDRWTCNELFCEFTCFSRDNFSQHLLTAHKFPTRSQQPITRSAMREMIEAGHRTARVPSSTEVCCFCDSWFPTCYKLMDHIAKHLELITLPVLRLVDELNHTQKPKARNPKKQEDLSLPLPRVDQFLGIHPESRPPSPFPGRGLGSYSDVTPDQTRPLLRPFPPTGDDEMHSIPPYYFESVIFPKLFPIVQLTWHSSNISYLIANAMYDNESYYRCCLMMAAHHYKTMEISSDDIDSDIARYHNDAITGLRDMLGDAAGYRKALETSLGLILYQCHVGSYDRGSNAYVQWHYHLQGAISLARLSNLPTPNPKYPTDATSGWNRFHSSIIAWVDILGATMKGSAPFFRETYRELHLSNGDNHLGTRELTGCDDRLMYLISEIACLDNLMKDGLDDAELRRHISALDELLSANSHAVDLELTYLSDGSPSIEHLSNLITRAFLWAARIYLYSLDPTFSPDQPYCTTFIKNVTATIEAIPSGPNGFDQCLVWPYLISGSVCAASSDLRQTINTRIQELGDAVKVGSFSGLVTVLREVWRRNDSSSDVSGNTIRVSWRHVMQDMEWDYLLI